jgi:lysophospholipase L1-like esterase
VKQLLGAALLAAAAPALAVLGELAARRGLARWGGYYRYVPGWRERRAFDGALFPFFPPTAMMEINRDGERGGPPPGAGERGYRALVVGGSAAECYFLDQGATWAAVVERLLNEPEALAALGAPRVHVGNVARAILPCADLAFMLSKILPRYGRLDAVLIMVGAADLVSWMERGMPPSLPDGPGGRLPLGKVFEQHPEGPWGWKPRQTALWRLASTLNRRLRRPLAVEADSSGWLRKVRRMRADAPTRIDDAPDVTPVLERFELHLTRILRAAQAKSARVILVRQPWLRGTRPEDEAMRWNFGLGRPYREEVKAYFTPRVVDALMQRIDARASAVAADLGVEQVDLMPELEQSARTFYDELHFTPEGAEAVGRVVAAALLAPHSSTGP